MSVRDSRILMAAIAMSGALAAGAQTATNTSSDRARGRDHFVAFGCYSCHGYTGETGQTGVQLNPTRLPLVAFVAYVRNPPRISDYVFAMPAYDGKDVTDQVLADIYAYLVSLPSNTPPLEEIELLSED